MKQFIFATVICCLSFGAQSQKLKYIKIGITNSQTARPFTKFSALFTSPIHPGFELGYGMSQRIGKRSQWFFEPAIAYTFHRWVQHNISIVAQEYFCYMLGAGFSITARLGAGYQLSIPTTTVFELSGETIKSKPFAARSQFIFNGGVGANKSIDKHGMMIGLLYQQKIQTPFVRNYVPLLPYNSMMISLTIPISQKN
ncbi:MAG TPA: hypothetical protein VLC28_07705 [Flavitalea sp.]|nr:hypothetical protein [Flavitalea sp.]